MPGHLRYDNMAAMRLERMYGSSEMIALRKKVLATLKLHSGERVVDIGSGPGLLATEMAKVVGPTGSVTGIDISDSMLRLARERAESEGLTNVVQFEAGEASGLHFTTGSVDVAVSTLVLGYVDSVVRAVEEMYRILRSGGRALVLLTDWGSTVWAAIDRERMARVLNAWDNHQAYPSLPRAFCPVLEQCGFTVRSCRVFVTLNTRLSKQCYSYGLIEQIGDFITNNSKIPEQDVQAWVTEQHQLGYSGAYFFSVNRYLFLAIKDEPGLQAKPKFDPRLLGLR